MSEERDWRKAKPKWVVDAAEAEMRQWQLTAALSWPTELKPEPMPFRWGDYDRLTGDPVAGEYWQINGHKVAIRSRQESDRGWKRWYFRTGGGNWTDNVTRGALYASERDAWLATLWRKCEDCAEQLAHIRAMLR
jgi:hypothetical protein